MITATHRLHRPDHVEPGRCACGAEEVYFEPFGDIAVFGYGCDRQGEPYAREADRRGLHVRVESGQ